MVDSVTSTRTPTWISIKFGIVALNHYVLFLYAAQIKFISFLKNNYTGHTV